MADGLFYQDTREPFKSADESAVTLSTTDKALHLPAAFPVLGAGYFNQRIGKRMRIRAFGKLTTAATPGNGVFSLYFGTGADANGTVIAASAAQALTASQTNLSWICEFNVITRALGASGSLFGWGWAIYNEGVAAPHLLIPASAAVAVTVDVTSSNILSLQYKRSGSTAESMTLQDLEVTAMN